MVVCDGLGTDTGTASSACQSNMAGQAEALTVVEKINNWYMNQLISTQIQKE